MHCSDFLELYSDYRDGLLSDPATVRRVHRHLRGCRRCMNYDALVSRGVMTLRSINEIIPASRFEPTHLTPSESDGSSKRMVRAVPVAALVGALLTASAMLAFQSRSGSADAIVVGGVPVEAESPPQPAFATSIAAPDSAVPFVRNERRTPLITFTDLNAPGEAEPVESFSTWVTQSR